MTENIKPESSYSHADAMRMRNAIIKFCGETYDPIILLCEYLQSAVGKKEFAQLIYVMEMSEYELKKMFGTSWPKTLTQELTHSWKH